MLIVIVIVTAMVVVAALDIAAMTLANSKEESTLERPGLISVKEE